MNCLQRLKSKLDEIDREEAFQVWLEAGQPYHDGTILEWYRLYNHRIINRYRQQSV